MRDLPPRIGWRRTSKARRQAAERVLDENSTGMPADLHPTESPELQAELAAMRSLTQMLEQLPGQAWSPKIASNTATSQSATGASRWPWLGGRLPTAPGLSGALATAALAFVIGALLHPFSGTGPSHTSITRAAARVVLKPLPGTSGTSRAVAYMPGGGHMRLDVRKLPPSKPGTYYELWLMSSNTDLVSVTSFRTGASGTASLQLVLPDDPSHYRYLDVSVQHLGVAGISQHNVLRAAIPT